MLDDSLEYKLLAAGDLAYRCFFHGTFSCTALCVKLLQYPFVFASLALWFLTPRPFCLWTGVL